MELEEINLVRLICSSAETLGRICGGGSIWQCLGAVEVKTETAVCQPQRVLPGLQGQQASDILHRETNPAYYT